MTKNFQKPRNLIKKKKSFPKLKPISSEGGFFQKKLNNPAPPVDPILHSQS